MGKPARDDLNRSAYARHRAEYLHPQGTEGGWRAVGDRVRNLPRGEGSAQGSGSEVGSAAHAIEVDLHAAPNLRFDAGGAWSNIMANDTAGTASGNFTGTRWLVNGGLTGTYPWQMLVFEPSARSLGTFQPARNFETGRASAGVKAIYPFAWTSSTVALSPYAGLYRRLLFLEGRCAD